MNRRNFLGTFIPGVALSSFIPKMLLSKELPEVQSYKDDEDPPKTIYLLYAGRKPVVYQRAPKYSVKSGRIE